MYTLAFIFGGILDRAAAGPMKNKTLSFVFFLVAGALVLRLIRVGSQSIWVDEMLTLSVSIPDPGLTIWDYVKYNIHGPLHSFVVYLFHFVSVHEGWLRIPSVIAGVLAVYFFYRWTRIWLGEGIARVASIFLAIHPLHIYYSQEIRNYSFLFFFAMLSCYVFHRLLERETGKRFALYVIAMACAALSNFTAAFLFVVHSLIYVVRRGAPGRRILKWAAVGVLVLVLISPWVYRIYTFIDVTALVTPVVPGEIETTERLRGDTTVGAEAVPYLFYVFGSGFSMGPSTRELHYDASLSHVVRSHWMSVAWVGILFGFLALKGAAYVYRRRLAWGQILLYLAVPLILTLLLCWQNAKAFNVRYVLLSFPAFLCLVAAGVVSIRGRAGWIAGGLVAATLLTSTWNYFFDGRYARDDVKGAVSAVEARASEADCVLTHTVTEIVEHYLGGDREVYSVYAPPGTPHSRVDKQLQPVFAKCDTVWYIRAREWADDSDGYLLDLLQQNYTMSEVIVLDGVTVFVGKK
jgi:uncharacterized membrane protein